MGKKTIELEDKYNQLKDFIESADYIGKRVPIKTFQELWEAEDMTEEQYGFDYKIKKIRKGRTLIHGHRFVVISNWIDNKYKIIEGEDVSRFNFSRMESLTWEARHLIND